MKTIKISSYMKLCLSSREGERLRSIINDFLKNNDCVILDFSDITVFASPFFNISLGYFINEFGPEGYDKKIKVENLSQVGRKTYEKVIENAIDYYKSSKKDKINEIINKTEK